MSHPNSRNGRLKNEIKAEAYHLGFIDIGFTSPDVDVNYAQFLDWTEKGFQAGMQYLARNNTRAARQSAKNLLPECETVICLAYPYPLIAPTATKSQGRIASYALLQDYHITVSELANKLVTKIYQLLGDQLLAQVHLDTSPILEKSYARQAGLGWIGRNSLLIHPKYGSGLFLCEILINISIEPDPPFTTDGCQNCQRCVKACPTQAILPNRSIDARRCLSYLTIENRGEIPEEFRQAMGNRIFGCDQCQLACPYNKQSKTTAVSNNWQTTINPTPNLLDCFAMTEEEFHSHYKQNPVLRAKYTGFRRNLAIAMGNSENPDFLTLLRQAQNTETNPIVDKAIAWSINQLEPSANPQPDPSFMA